MIRYAMDARINCAGITDGDRWELYDISPSAALHEKRDTGPADLGLSSLSDRPKSPAPLAAQSLFSTTCTREKNDSHPTLPQTIPPRPLPPRPLPVRNHGCRWQNSSFVRERNAPSQFDSSTEPNAQ